MRLTALVLSHEQAKRFYDRFGRKQDWQAIYEDEAIDALIANGAFDEAGNVYEFGCGTGRLAERLLREHLPGDARYRAVDISETMVRLTRERLAAFGPRVAVIQSAGGMETDLEDGAVDRFVATYVLDLLGETDIQRLCDEARRVLAAEGSLCLVSLTFGTGFLSRLVTGVWRLLFRVRPHWLGGCRPIRLLDYIGPPAWRILYRDIVTRFGVSSEVVVAKPQ